MAAPLTAALPEGLALAYGYTITLDAIDPTTGAQVSGVIVSEGTVTASETAGTGASVEDLFSQYALVPGPGF